MNVHEKHRAIAHAAPPDSITREELEQLRKDAEIGTRWRENSSLEEWFPFTAKEMDRLRKTDGRIREIEDHRNELASALKLALEYWEHRQQRYKNRSPVWVKEARNALCHYPYCSDPTPAIKADGKEGAP